MMLFALAALSAAPRVMSADFCADQFVLALADRAQIAALSPDARKDFSHHRDAAQDLPQARPEAEAVLGIGADMVLRFWGGDASRLSRSGAEVVTLGYVADFAGVIANIRRAAAALGRERAGEALANDTMARLAALSERAADGPQPSALYVTPGGVTAGRQTMIDAIFAAAGVRNAAAEAGKVYWPALPAEALIAHPPELIVTGFFTARSEAANHWSSIRHPALRALFSETPTLHLEADVVACPGAFSLDAAEAIRDFVDAAMHARNAEE
jgi:iron complex transport system substrate-binding protein